MAISAAQLNILIRAEGAEQAERAINQVSGAVTDAGGEAQQAAGGFDAFFDSIQGGAGNALRALDGISKAMGSIALIGGVTLLAGGARAAWDQVNAVEQATFALGAYGDSAEEVNAALQDLTSYAQDASRSGGIFWSQDLFSAAQQLVVVGAELENVSEYVQIMSRAVGLGTVSFDELARVIGRVGATGRLTSIEFEMLTQWGFQLDESLRNTTVTWEELFAHLDRGIPADALLGQANTIQGALLYLRGALIQVGQAFLGVDEDLTFLEDGLGNRLVSSIGTGREALLGFRDTAESIGNAIVGVIDFITNLYNAFQRLPDGVQSVITSLLRLIAAFGALRVAGRSLGMIAGLMGLGGVTSGIGGLLSGGLFRGGATGARSFGGAIGSLIGRINPLGAALAVGAIALLDWINTAEQAKRAAEAYEASLEGLGRTITNLKLAGELDLASQAESVRSEIEDARDVFESMSGADDFMKDWAEKRFIDPTDLWIGRADEYRYEFQAMSRDYQEMLDHLEGMDGALAKVNEGLSMDNIDQARFLADVLERFRDAGDDPVLLAGAFSWLKELDFADYAIEIDAVEESMRRLGATSEEVSEIFADLPRQISDLRIDGLNRQADEIESLADVWEQSFIPQYRPQEGFGLGAPIEEMNELIDDLDADKLERLGSDWERIVDALASGNFDNARLLADVMSILGDDTLSIDQQADAIADLTDNLHEYVNVAREMLAVLGQDDLTSMLNLAGIGGEAVEAAANVNQLAASMDTLFRVVVGNTNAIGSQFQALFDWADDLIAEEGVWSKLDDLLVAGRISGEHGVFTGDSEYARAQQAYNSILEDNAAIQEHILTIQAKQAPLLAANASAMEAYMGRIADLPIDEQLAALGFMDAGLQDQLGTVIELAGQFSTMGAEGEAGFRAMAEGIMHTNPALFAMMETMGLIKAERDEITGEVLSFEVDLSGATTVQDTLNDLIESIDALTLALDGMPPVRVDTSEVDPAIEKLNALRDAVIGAVQAGLGNIGAGGGSGRTGRRWGGDEPPVVTGLPNPAPNETYDNGVPIVTGLPNTGTGGTVTFTADDSAVAASVERVSAMVAVVDGMEATIDILGDDSAYGQTISEVSASLAVIDAMEATVSIGADASSYGDTISQVSASLFAVNDWQATVQIYGDGSAYGETITEVWNSLLAVNDWSATVSILADASDVYQTISDLQIYQGTTIATSYVDIVTRRIDPAGSASGLGRSIRGFADGGVVNDDIVMVGERGPELVSLPHGSYVHTNAETMRMMNSGKGGGQSQGGNDNSIHVSFDGATFSSTNREEMNKWAEEDLIPGIARAVGDRRTGMGAAV